MADRNTALTGILEHMRKQGGPISGWYAGVTSNIAQRLYTEHNLPRGQNACWSVWYQCNNDTEARAVEESLLRMGCDGGGGGGDASCIYVYAYLKQWGTNP